VGEQNGAGKERKGFDEVLPGPLDTTTVLAECRRSFIARPDTPGHAAAQDACCDGKHELNQTKDHGAEQNLHLDRTGIHGWHCLLRPWHKPKATRSSEYRL
jgi:hypothetical protein